MMEYNLCKDNLICCDDNCQRCANLIYDRYMELLKRLPEGSACEARKPFECDITETVKKEKKTMAEYIDRAAIRNELYEADAITMKGVEVINNFPAADVVEVETLKAWLYQIAMNNVGQPIEDMASACEEIANRLDGLRTFAREKQ